MNPYAYSVLAFGFCSFLIGLFVWLRLSVAIGFTFFLFSAASGLWAMIVGICLTDNVSYETALFCARTSNAAASLIPAAWFWFTMDFSESKWTANKKITAIILSCVSVFILLNAFSDDFIPRVRSILQFRYFSVPGWIHYLFTVNFFVGVTLGFKNLLWRLKNLSGERKKACSFLVLSTLAGFVGGSLSFLPIYGILFPQYGMLLMPVYPILMAIAMMRFDLFSIKDFAVAAHKDKLASLGILATSVNHEIRAPLFVIRGSIEAGVENSELKKKVLSQVDRITGIVSRLTHFAKKGVDEEAKIEPVDMVEVLNDIRPLFQHQINYQQIEFIQAIPSNLSQVLADKRYLEEILFNLILNACQILKNQKDGKISICAKQREKQLLIEVADNGPGISSEQIKNIFKPFYTTKQEGTGLGLYITKQLIEKCNGMIKIDDQFKRGTRFILSFKTI